jgi:hypothetical protein
LGITDSLTVVGAKQNCITAPPLVSVVTKRKAI